MAEAVMLLKREQIDGGELGGREKFLAILKDLGLEPFVKQSVIAYKKKMVRKESNFLGRHPRLIEKLVVGDVGEFLSLAVVVVIVLFGLPATATCLLFKLIFYVYPLGGEDDVSWWFVFGFGTMTVAALVLFYVLNRLFLTVREAKWIRLPINLYARPIPEFVSQTVADVTEQDGQVKLFIEELVVTQRKEWFFEDPFLVAVAGGEEYYLEVWNESRFSQKRLV